MPDINHYLNLAQQENEPKAQVRLSSDGEELRVRGRMERLSSRLGSSAADQNHAVLQDFRSALTEAYGAKASQHAFGVSGLAANQLEASPDPLQLEKIQSALKAAVDYRVEVDDLEVRGEYDRCEERAGNWVPQTRASHLSEDDFKGLRLHSNQHDGVQIHGWHPRNVDAKVEWKADPNFDSSYEAMHELDHAVLAEMQSLPELNDQPRAQNLQARLNLLEKMVSQSEAAAIDGQAQIFIAPEWLFSGMEGEYEGKPAYGGALAEAEMQKVTQALVEMSASHQGVTIVAGSILWSKPAEEMLLIEGQLTPADMVFNSCPVVQDGSLLHVAYKLNQGFDPDLSARGQTHEKAYDTPGPRTPGARLQVFMNDGSNPHSGKECVQNLQAKMKVMSAPESVQRAWETPLRHGVPPSGTNNLFTAHGKTVGIDICADHGFETTRKEVTAKQGVNSLANTVNANNGVDMHLVVAAGANISRGKCFAKPGGNYSVVDLNDGVLAHAKSLSVKPDTHGGGRDLTVSAAARKIPSSQEPVTVGVGSGHRAHLAPTPVARLPGIVGPR